MSQIHFAYAMITLITLVALFVCYRADRRDILRHASGSLDPECWYKVKKCTPETARDMLPLYIRTDERGLIVPFVQHDDWFAWENPLEDKQ